ncbi:MAG: hypothetical protein ABIP93_01230 [Gemmatimonadaceae bacterium]
MATSARVHAASKAHAAPTVRATSRHGPGALLVRAVALLLIGAIPVAFSAQVDPARLVASRDEEAAIARALASGMTVTDFTNYDDRAIERSLATLRPVPKVLVLGSSRMQPLAASAFPGATFANAAMQGGTLDDMLAVYALYDVDGRRPRQVVLGIDPWTQSYRAAAGWGTLVDERATMLRRIGVPASPWRDRVTLETALLKRLASPEYFRLSVFSFRRHGAGGITWRSTDLARSAEKSKRPDGSVVWADVPRDAAGALAARYAAEALSGDARFARLDARASGHPDLLERFVRYLRGQGVEVTLLLAPYPPDVYDAFSRLPGHSVAAVEADLRAMSARSGASLLGSYDPKPSGMTTRDFFDESHLRPEALARLLVR